MQITVSNWGNSLGIRIPKSIAKLLGIKDGAAIDLEIEDHKLILSPLSHQDLSLTELASEIDINALVSRVNAKNRPDELDDSPVVGTEVW